MECLKSGNILDPTKCFANLEPQRARTGGFPCYAQMEIDFLWLLEVVKYAQSGACCSKNLRYPTKRFTFWRRLVWQKNNINLALTEKQLFLCFVWLSKASIDFVSLPQASIDDFFRPQKCETFGRVVARCIPEKKKKYASQKTEPIEKKKMGNCNCRQLCASNKMPLTSIARPIFLQFKSHFNRRLAAL